MGAHPWNEHGDRPGGFRSNLGSRVRVDFRLRRKERKKGSHGRKGLPREAERPFQAETRFFTLTERAVRSAPLPGSTGGVSTPWPLRFRTTTQVSGTWPHARCRACVR